MINTKKTNKLIFCEKCRNFKIEYPDRNGYRPLKKWCALTETLTINAERSYYLINEDYKIKNKNNDCKDFKRKKFLGIF